MPLLKPLNIQLHNQVPAQYKGKRRVLLIGDSMIKAIERQNLSKSQSVKKICSRGAKIAAIKDHPIPALQHTVMTVS